MWSFYEHPNRQCAFIAEKNLGLNKVYFMGKVNLISTSTPIQQEEVKFLIEKPPDLPPSRVLFLEIVQGCLKAGSAVVNKPVKYTICPDCGNPSEYFQQQVIDDENYPIVITSCPACGWIQGMELSSKHKTLG
ncbi:MAG: hypothetical protein ACLFUY_02305 [Desulfobacterales bacterium]